MSHRQLKKKGPLVILILFLVIALFGTGCQVKSIDPISSSETTTQEEATTQVQATTQEEATKTEPVLKAFASVYPVYYFAQRIGGERLEVSLVIPPGTDAHDFEPKAKLIGEMSSADLFFYNGLGLEHWSENLFAQLPSSVSLVETAKGIETYTIEEAMIAHKEHEHQDEEEHEHEHNGLDPHIWLDPSKAILQASNILESLKVADPEGASLYTGNYEVLKEELEKLDTAFKTDLSNFKRREIVVGHAAFGYLTKRYDLVQLAISGISPLEEPSAAALGELTHLVEDYKVTTIFSETLASPKFSDVLAAETGTKTAVLNPLEGLTQADLDANEDYMSIMYKNLEVIKAALQD